MLLTLRDYQARDVQTIRAAMRTHRHVLFQAPTGYGKTIVFSFVTESAARKGRRVWIVVHRQELLAQTERALSGLGLDYGVIQGGREMDQTKQIQICSVQTLARRLDRIVVAPDLLILDECFTGETLVDGVKICAIKVGDKVTTHAGIGTVTHIFKRIAPKKLYSIKTQRGNGFVCTGNHPIWTQRGFIQAKDLTTGDMVLTIIPYEVRNMRSGNPGREKVVRESGMQIGVIEENDSAYLQHAWRRNNVMQENERNERPEDAGIGIRKTSSDGMETTSSRRERKAADNTSTGSRGGIGMGHGSLYQHEDAGWERVSSLLQGGYWKRELEDCRGGGWVFSLRIGTEGSGQKERRVFEVDRVESISIQKRGSEGEPARNREADFVYNLEVDNGNTYFANGILVHNCHHAAAGTWKRILTRFPKAWLLGVTATPERLDGKGLDGVFDFMVRGPNVAWLMEEGWLSRARYILPPTKADIDHLRIRGGDYDLKDMESAMDQQAIIGDAVKHYKKYCCGAQSIAFCATIKHAEHVAEQFREAGFAWEVLDGTLSDDVRRDRVSALGDGRLNGLSTCEIVNEGFDLPVVTAALLMRPTQSLGLHLQQIGRILRPLFKTGLPIGTREERLSAISDGTKPYAVVLDHVGNLRRHGLAEDVRDWQLIGNAERRMREKSAPEDRIVQCPKCYAVHKPAPVCPFCGYVYGQGREIKQVKGELIELRPDFDWKTIDGRSFVKCQHCGKDHVDGLPKCPHCGYEAAKVAAMKEKYERRREQSQARTLEDLLAIEKARGYKSGWARAIMRAREERHESMK